MVLNDFFRANASHSIKYNLDSGLQGFVLCYEQGYVLACSRFCGTNFGKAGIRLFESESGFT